MSESQKTQQQALNDLNLTSDLHRVGLGYSIQFTMRAGHLQCEWTPRMPRAKDQQRVNVKYEAARDLFIAELLRAAGEAEAVVVEARP